MLVGFLFVAQWRGNARAGSELQDLSPQDLAIVVQEMTAENEAMRAEAGRLEVQMLESAGSEKSRKALLEQVRRELENLRVASGLAAATGPGVALHVSDPKRVLLVQDCVNILNELRNAGAEAVVFGDVRATALTGFSMGTSGLAVDGSPLPRDFTVRAIGDPATLRQALLMPGGLVPTLEAFPGVSARVVAEDRIDVPPSQRLLDAQGR
jgi:uncharacterized protein YlxW (UPF0749 family)